MLKSLILNTILLRVCIWIENMFLRFACAASTTLQSIIHGQTLGCACIRCKQEHTKRLWKVRKVLVPLKKRLEVLMSSCAVETIKPPPPRLNVVHKKIQENMLLV